jgi:hypothetical protein
MKTPLLALAVACVLAVAAAPAAAQPRMDAVVRTQLDSAVVLMRGQGFALQGALRAGALANGAQEELRLPRPRRGGRRRRRGRTPRRCPGSRGSRRG